MPGTGSGDLPPADLFHGKKPSDSGSLLGGSRGSIFSSSDDGSEQMVLGADRPESARSEDSEKKGDRPKPPNPDELHKAEWIRAIWEDDPRIAWSNFGDAGVLTEAMLMGNVAVRLGKPIEYDADAGRVTNSSEAEPYIRPAFRKGWGL